MLFTHRLRLLAFGLTGWSVTMFTAAGNPDPLAVACAAVQGGLMAGCFATALLPGRTARFL